MFGNKFNLIVQTHYLLTYKKRDNLKKKFKISAGTKFTKLQQKYLRNYTLINNRKDFLRHFKCNNEQHK